MPSPAAAAGLMAAFAVLFAGVSLASDPVQPSVSEGTSAESAAPGASSDSAPAASNEEAVSEEEGSAEEAVEATAPEEMTLEEAAAQAQVIEQAKPFDPSKASRKELDAYNADREPEQRFQCEQTYPTGSRRPTKVCMTQAQWREYNRQR